MRVALAQINPTVGDIAGNETKVREQLARAREAGAQLVLVPELAISGYPPEDLLLKEHFLADARAAVERIAADVHGIVALVGFPERADDAYNAAAVLADGRIQAIYRKVNLPNYGVFDELRYFQHGPGGATIDVDGVKVGLTICEDIWVPGAPMTDEALAGAAAGAQHLRLALPGGQGAPARADDRPARARQPGARSPSAPWSAARTSWSSTATRSSSTTTAT